MASSSAYAGARDYNGLMSGAGALSTPHGATYEGEFLDGHFHGAGTLVFANGARYRARWEAGIEVPGSGSYQWADGLAYNLPEQPDGVGTGAAEAAPAGAAAPAGGAAAGGGDVAVADLARWPYLTPHDRRLWSEHKAGVRANVGYEVTARKQQLSTTTLGIEAVAGASLRATVSAAKR